MAKGDTGVTPAAGGGVNFQTSGVNPGLNWGNMFSQLGSSPQTMGQGAPGGSIGPSANYMATMNPWQKFFNTMGGGVGPATPQQPYTQGAMSAPPIAPTNTQNIAATFFKNLGAY